MRQALLLSCLCFLQLSCTQKEAEHPIADFDRQVAEKLKDRMIETVEHPEDSDVLDNIPLLRTRYQEVILKDSLNPDPSGCEAFNRTNIWAYLRSYIRERPSLIDSLRTDTTLVEEHFRRNLRNYGSQVLEDPGITDATKEPVEVYSSCDPEKDLMGHIAYVLGLTWSTDPSDDHASLKYGFDEDGIKKRYARITGEKVRASLEKGYSLEPYYVNEYGQNELGLTDEEWRKFQSAFQSESGPRSLKRKS